MKRIINKIKRIIIKILAYMFVVPFIKKSKLTKAVAIVLYGGLGDGVLWLQYANDTIKHYEEKGYEVYLICNKSLELLYKTYTNFNKVIVVSNNLFNNFESLKNTLKEINSVYFEEVINIRRTKEKSQDLYLIKNIKAKWKIGYFENYTDKRNIKIQNKIFNELITVPENDHEINAHHHFLKCIGIKTNQNLYYLKNYAKQIDNENYISLCIGASDSKRIWDVNNWIDVVKYILDNTDYKIYFCGAKQEEFVYNAIQGSLKSERLINKCGKTSLQELIDILANSKFVIANDSGPGHIASSVQSKGIILLGGGYNFRFFPHKNLENKTTGMKVLCVPDKCWNCSWACSESMTDFPCIKKITSKMLITELENLF